MSDALRCTVVIPTYNRSELLRHSLDSLTRQRMPANQFEVIVVDDGSTDDTADVATSFQDRLDLRYHYQPDEGFRAAAARNIGIADARSPICVFTDSGVMLHADNLNQHVASHQSTTGPAAVLAYVYGCTDTGEYSRLVAECLDVDDLDGSIARMQAKRECRDIRELFYDRYGEDLTRIPAPWQIFWTGNVSAQTTQLRAVGGFDEQFRTWGGEDLDLGYRLHLNGATFIFNRQAKAVHIPHERVLHTVIESGERSHRYMAEKYRTPVIDLLADLPMERYFDFNELVAGLPAQPTT
ncbi:glycosyltransferase [Micromonospora sp. WMMD1082]|uniref:glycosyltransferase n=1 Tax=Micromonospora sp. WMMD1082 TaxID=3016104 RepID=UPI0024169376|nr:glycosyltransferase [Micromonospora sp. WMMD1082]MDG4792789.1 glycosyltransferase [Micromonospora sp. WMMD1082]